MSPAKAMISGRPQTRSKTELAIDDAVNIGEIKHSRALSTPVNVITQGWCKRGLAGGSAGPAVSRQSAIVWRMIWKGPPPESRAVSIVVRKAAS